MIERALKLSAVGNLLLRLTEAGGDPGIFCYRMGVDLLSTDNGRFLAPVSVMARWAAQTLAVSKGTRPRARIFTPFSPQAFQSRGAAGTYRSGWASASLRDRFR